MKGKDPTKPTEAVITRQIRSYLDLIGVWHWKQWQGPMSQPRGVADILGVVQGKLLAIEVKRPGCRLTTHQAKFLDCVNRNGGVAFEARSVEDVERELKGRFLVG